MKRRKRGKRRLSVAQRRKRAEARRRRAAANRKRAAANRKRAAANRKRSNRRRSSRKPRRRIRIRKTIKRAARRARKTVKRVAKRAARVARKRIAPAAAGLIPGGSTALNLFNTFVPTGGTPSRPSQFEQKGYFMKPADILRDLEQSLRDGRMNRAVQIMSAIPTLGLPATVIQQAMGLFQRFTGQTPPAGPPAPPAGGGYPGRIIPGMGSELATLMALGGQPIVGASIETRLKAPKGYVIVQLPFAMGQFPPGSKVAMYKPIARKLGLWKPRTKPVLTGGDVNALRKAERLQKRIETLTKKHHFTKKLIPKQNKSVAPKARTVR